MTRRFALVRDIDVNGVSGVGIVAHGVQFPDGTACMRWDSRTASTSVWQSVADLVRVHGHEGRTRIVWLDPEER